MKCNNCLYEKNCFLRRYAEDITGCEGHSKERPPKPNEVKCNCCGKWVNENEVFTHIDGKHHICFNCY